MNLYAQNPDGTNLPLLVSALPGDSDLAGLYQSITNGFAVNTSASGNDIDSAASDSFYNDNPSYDDGNRTPVMENVGIADYSGAEGTIIDGSDNSSGTGSPGLNPTSSGTVEAWVYVEEHANYAGIVHKGIQHDFSDEGYSLQFWGKKGNVAFAIVQQNPYKYSLKSSGLRLNLNKWYFIVGRWNSSKVYLDIYYYDSSGNTKVQRYSKNNTLATKDPYPNSGPLIIGSQYQANYGKKGYYGFKGSINGVFVSDYKKSNDELYDYYNYMKDKTSTW